MNDIERLKSGIDILRKMTDGELKPSWDDYRKQSSWLSMMPNTWMIPKNLSIFRGSLVQNDDLRHDLKDRYSYPPKNKCSQSRCNIAGYPVFYASNKFIGAIQETLMTQQGSRNFEDYDKIIYVSHWTIAEEIESLAFDFRVEFPIKENKEKEYLIREFFQLLSKLFRIDAYEFSSGLSFLLLYGIEHEKQLLRILEQPKLLVYPSIIKDGTFENYAFHPEYLVNNYIMLDRIFKLKIPLNNWQNAFREINTYPVKVLEVGKLRWNDGKILVWSAPTEKDVQFLQFHGVQKVDGVPFDLCVVQNPQLW